MKKVLLVIRSILFSSRFWQDIKHFGFAMIGYGAYSAVHDGYVFSGVIIGTLGAGLWLSALAALQFTEERKE